MKKTFIRESYWNEKRLEKLEELRKTHSIRKLVKHFRKTPEEIGQALNYIEMSKKLTVSVRVENGVRITHYQAWYAHGASTSAKYENRPKRAKKPRKSAKHDMVDELV